MLYLMSSQAASVVCSSKALLLFSAILSTLCVNEHPSAKSVSFFFLTVLKLWILTNNLNALSSSSNFGYPMFGISYRKAVCLHSLEMSALLLHVLCSRKSLAQSDPEVSWSRHSENTCVKTSQLLSKIIQKYNQKNKQTQKTKNAVSTNEHFC